MKEESMIVSIIIILATLAIFFVSSRSKKCGQENKSSAIWDRKQYEKELIKNGYRRVEQENNITLFLHENNLSYEQVSNNGHESFFKSELGSGKTKTVEIVSQGGVDYRGALSWKEQS